MNITTSINQTFTKTKHFLLDAKGMVSTAVSQTASDLKVNDYKNFLKTALRVTIAAAVIMSLPTWLTPVAFMLASSRSGVLGFGFINLKAGAFTVINAIATGALYPLLAGIALTGTGYYMLKHHKHFFAQLRSDVLNNIISRSDANSLDSLGYLESRIEAFSEKNAKSLDLWIKSKLVN